MEKKIIGYTTGVYDMFHIGHLNILKRAKEQCDYLIVGVSTDELVEDYKHKTPVIPFNERFEIVSAIKYVDQVVPQKTMDKMVAWRELHYNRLFHGNEWKGTDTYNKIEQELGKVGVEVVYLPHTDGISSSQLTDFIKGKLEKK